MGKNILEKRDDGKYKLVEQIVIDGSKLNKLPLTESQQIVNIEGKDYKCIAAYSKVPISICDVENLNERIYTGKLWDNVIQNQKHIWEGAVGLADHPDTEGSVKDIFCVWHNLKKENIEGKDRTVGDMFLVGTHGELANQVLDAGGKIGISTSGFGDFQEDGKTIDESYELERPGDWVLSPSFEIFANKENEVKVSEANDKDKKDVKDDEKDIKKKDDKDDKKKNDDDDKKKKDKKDKDDDDDKKKDKDDKDDKDDKKKDDKDDDKKKEDIELSIKSTTNKADNSSSKKETTMVEDQVRIVEENNYKLNIKSLVKEALKKESVQERLVEFNEILSYFKNITFADEQKKIVIENIEKCEVEVAELTEKGKEVNSLKESKKTTEEAKTKVTEDFKQLTEDYEKLSEKYEVSLTMLEELKVYANQVKNLYECTKAEKNGMLEAEDYVKLHKYTEKLEASLKELNKKEEIKIIESKKTPRKQGVMNFKNEVEVKAYYEDLLEQHPEVEEIKEQILNCKTIVEAQNMWLNLEDEIIDNSTPYQKRHIEDKEVVFESKSKPTIKRLLNEGWD